MSSIQISGHALNLTGKRFGRLKALWPTKRTFAKSGAAAIHWLCGCDCGSMTVVWASDLSKKDGTRSCGCLIKESAQRMGRSWLKHGESGYYLRDAWEMMIARCGNPDHAAFADYGGRGITVCDRWIHGDGTRGGLDCFKADMGERPSPDHSLDRTKNWLGYSKENCRWATRVEQMRNTRSNLMVTAFGKTAPLAEFTNGANTLFYSLVWQRIKRWGWDVERALTTRSRKCPLPVK